MRRGACRPSPGGVDRAHRRFTDTQIEFLANVVRLWRGEGLFLFHGSDALLTEHGLDGGYIDVAGLCKVASRAEIAAKGWSLNPGSYDMLVTMRINGVVATARDIKFTMS